MSQGMENKINGSETLLFSMHRERESVCNFLICQLDGLKIFQHFQVLVYTHSTFQ